MTLCTADASSAAQKNIMKKISEVIVKNPVSTYMGSEKTAEAVKNAIAEHPQLGPKYAKDFDPYHSAMTFNTWKRQGYVVKKGSKAIQSYTILESEDPKTGEKQMVRRSVLLFHKSQVQPITETKQNK